MAGLEISDLTVEYSTAGYVVRVIDSLSVQASSGELVLLLGPSGSGKTTILSCLAGILTPTRGTIVLGDVEVTSLRGERLTDYRRHSVGIVFQGFNLIPSLTALENVAAPLHLAGVPAHQAFARAETLLGPAGLADRMRHRPASLSGGQQQRVAIARGLAHDPLLLLADEPTAHLDYVQVEGILRVLRELASSGRLVVVATHDERMIPLADRVVELAPRFGAASRPPERVRLRRGEVLFEQGSRGDLIYIVKSGEIEIAMAGARGADQVVSHVGPGEYFGELGPLLGFPRTATARARVPAIVVGYTVRDFRELLGPERLSKILGRTAGRGIRRCEGCGAHIDPEDRFCRSCGTSLVPPTAKGRPARSANARGGTARGPAPPGSSRRRRV